MAKNIKKVCDECDYKSSEDVLTVTSGQQSDEVDLDTRIDCLDDNSLYYLLSYLTLKEKLSIERVSKRWQSILRQLLSRETGLGTTWTSEEDENCLDAKRRHSVVGGDMRDAIPMSNGWFYDLTDPKAIDNLKILSKKCPNVKCFHINNSIIDCPTLELLVHLFPEFECLHLRKNILKSIMDSNDDKKAAEEWDKIGRILGPILIHLSIDPHYERRMTETHMKNLIQHLKCLKELRIGTHFEREVVGNFVSVLTTNCKLFYSLGRELNNESLNILSNSCGQKLTHLSYFSKPAQSVQNIETIGEKLRNLVKLKINLSFNELILTSSSPISSLKQLKEFSIDMNTFTDAHVDDGLVWCLKDGLPSVQVLEISRACLSLRSFNAIVWCLPQLNKLILRTVQMQCMCASSGIRDRTERYNCSVCKHKCWQSVANYKNLRELHIFNYYYRSDTPKKLDEELCELLPQFQCLRHLLLFRYDIKNTKLFEFLNELMDKSDRNDVFTLDLKSVDIDLTKIVKTPKVLIIRDFFML